MQLNMSEQELRNLQIYIRKRNQGQTDEQVINHITKINSKTPLTQEEWHKLIFPSCNNGYVEILRFILNNIQCLNNVKEYMLHTVYGRNENINDETRLWLIEKNEDNVVAVVIDLETFSMENHTKVE